MSQSKKFQKIAAPPRRTPPASSASTTTPASSTAAGSTPANPVKGFFDLLSENMFGENAKNFSPDELKEAMEYVTSLLAGWNLPERYKPSAFISALEMDKNRGYKDTAHSQGFISSR